MSKLEKLYSIIENSKEVGVKLNKDVLQQVEELEENIIKEEILPALGSDIAPRLKPIKRDLVLVVEYHPGEPISVALSRKAKISEIMGAKTLTPRSSTPVKSDEEPDSVEPHEPTKQILNLTKGLRVTFPDGTVICKNTAIDTFIETLRKIGLKRVSALEIKHGNGYNLVSKKKRPTTPGRIWQHECDGWYIYSNCSNSSKVEDLKQISSYYHLGLKIEEGKPGNVKTIRQPIITSQSNLPIKVQYHSYLLKRKSESTARGYTSTLDNSVRKWIRQLVDEKADSIYSYTKSKDVQLCIKKLKANLGFLAENERRHNSLSAALNAYLQFIKDWESR